MQLDKEFGVASGVLIIAIGTALLALRPRRRGSAVFAFFCFFWGANSVSQNLQVLVSEPVTKGSLVSVAIFSGVAATALLLAFSITFGSPRVKHVPGWLVMIASVSAGVAVWFALSPSAFVSLVRSPTGEVFPQYTFVTTVLVFIPFFAAFYAALLTLAKRFVMVDGEAERQEAAVIILALGVYVTYTVGFYCVFYVTAGLAAKNDSGLPSLLALLALFLVGAIHLLILVFRVLKGGYAHALPRAGSRPVVFGFVTILLVGVATALPVVWGGEPIRLHGLVRMITAALIAYGILKHQLFGIDLKIKWTIHKGTILAIFAGVFFFVDQAAQYFVSDFYGALAGTIASVLLLFLLSPVRTFATRVADRIMPHVHESPEYHNYRKFTLYRAAAETAARDGVITPDERSMLDSLKRELGLAPEDAAAVEREALGVNS